MSSGIGPCPGPRKCRDGQRCYFHGGPGCMECAGTGYVWRTWPRIGTFRCKLCQGTGQGGPMHHDGDPRYQEDF